MYVIQAGFLDGRHGLVLCVLQAYGVFLKWARVWEWSVSRRRDGPSSCPRSTSLRRPGKAREGVEPVLGILKAVWRRPKMLNVGDQAPDFEVQDHTGKTRRLSDYRGKNVVLWFYPKASTPG